jgi:hypothetical protein
LITREWRTCRLFDPAIDLSPKLDESGHPVMRMVDGGEEPVTVSDIAAFAEDRDEKHLAILPDKSPVWFHLAPLSVRQMRDHVGRATTVDERNLRALECALLRVDGLEASTITMARKDGGDFPIVRDGELDRLLAAGMTMADLWDIGAAAFVRAAVPKGCGAALHVPRSSMVALAARTASFRTAEPSGHDSPKPAQAKEAIAETTPQAG